MAIRNIREIGEEVLTKKCREVTEMTPRIRELIEDMLETMYEANGVGLAASQVGVLKRIVVIDTTGEDPYILINPRIVESSGEQTRQEGCLSVPGKSGQVTRPNYVKAVALDMNMREFELEGTELLARAICHELDHLEGIVYVDKVEGELYDVEPEERSVRRAILKTGEKVFPCLFDVKQADIRAQSSYMRKEKEAKLEAVRRIYQHIMAQNQCISLKTLAVSGKDLIEEAGMKPGAGADP